MKKFKSFHLDDSKMKLSPEELKSVKGGANGGPPFGDLCKGSKSAGDPPPEIGPY